MSRSFKKAIIKDRPRNYKKSTKYWRVIRRCQKQAVNSSKDVPNPKSIVNDYDYCDWIWDYEYTLYKYNKKIENYATKARRK